MKLLLKKASMLLLLFALKLTPSLAQKSQSVSFHEIFADLPFNDAASNSILRENEDAAEKIRTNIFIKPILSKKHCYVGELVLLTFKLYTYLQSTSTVVRKPYVPGFFTSALKVSNETSKFEKENGKEYRVFTILKWQLIPEKAGILEIDSIQLNNQVQYKDENGSVKKYSGTISSQPLKILVDPLPESGKPKKFSGLAGKFNLLAYPNYNNTQAGKENILRLEISGIGNFMMAAIPAIDWPQDIEIFSTTEKVEISKDSFPLTGRKIFEVSFVPRKDGKLVIPPIYTSYFDVEAKTYRTLSTQPVELTILPAEKLAATQQKQSSQPSQPSNSIFFYGSLSAVLLLGGAFFWIKRKRGKKTSVPSVSDPVQNDNESMKKPFEEGFAEEINKLNKITDSLEFINSFKDLLTNYLQAKTGTFLSQEERLVSKLQSKDSLLAEEVQDLYQQCNMFLYSPASLSATDRSSMIMRISNIRKRLDSIWD